MYAFDDEGGFLPLQEVGVTASGQIPSGKLGLKYVAEIGNGRDHLLGGEPAQNQHDANNGKSVNFAIASRPAMGNLGCRLGFRSITTIWPSMTTSITASTSPPFTWCT